MANNTTNKGQHLAKDRKQFVTVARALPDDWQRWATEDLVDALMECTPQQIKLILAVVDAQHFAANPPVPTTFIVGKKSMVSHGIYYNTTNDPNRTAWPDDPVFMAALELAKRLALQNLLEDEMQAVREARHKARLAAGVIMTNLIGIATSTDPLTGNGRAVHNREQIAASQVVLKYAGIEDTVEQQAHIEQDWWEAAEGA